MGFIGLIVAPPGAGKTALAEYLLRNTPCVKQTTCTTRNPRPGEIDGVHYHFLTETDFKKAVEAGEFIETFRYAGNNYGTRYKDLAQSIAEDKDVIIVMEINGAMKIKEHFPDCSKIIFLERAFEELVMAILERDVPNEEKAARIVQILEDQKVAKMDCVDFVVKNEMGKLQETAQKVYSLLK